MTSKSVVFLMALTHSIWCHHRRALPQQCRNFAAFLPQLCRTFAATLPPLCRAFAATLLQICRAFAAPLPHFRRDFAATLPQKHCNKHAIAKPARCGIDGKPQGFGLNHERLQEQITS
jgi:hypothetical protein